MMARRLMGARGARRFDAIGVQGEMGFGVGVCPPALLPTGFVPLAGYDDPQSGNYGNYLYGVSQCVWVPAHYYRIGHPESPRYAVYGLDAVDIAPLSAYASDASANLDGYILDRSFVDGGKLQPGVMVDKYMASPSASNTHSVSIAGGVPISLTTTSTYTRSATMTGCVGQYHDALTLSRARGGAWQCTSAFVYTMLARLATAHGQAATGPEACAWYDAARLKNWPKGANNNALGDSSEPSLLWLSAGDAGAAAKPRTGSCAVPAKAAHNGQANGIMDLNGGMWEVAIGVTIPGASASDAAAASNGDLWVLRPEVAIATLTPGWAGPTDAWQSAASIGALYERAEGAMWWSNAAAWVYLGNGAEQVFSGATSGLDRVRTALGIPRPAGASAGGTARFGNDGLYRYWRRNLALLVSGYWNDASRTGVGCRAWGNSRTTADNTVSFRASAYVL